MYRFYKIKTKNKKQKNPKKIAGLQLQSHRLNMKSEIMQITVILILRKSKFSTASITIFIFICSFLRTTPTED